MHKLTKISFIVSALVAGFAGVSSAASPLMVSGVPIKTFCASYAKEAETKSIATSLAIKIKEKPFQKAALLRQYQSFTLLGKQHCKIDTAVKSVTPAAKVVSPTSMDISNNKPIIITTTANYQTPADYFTSQDITNIIGLTPEQTQKTLQRIARAKEIYANIVETFISKDWLVPSDRNEMVGKIGFKFSQNCNELDGKILVRQWYDKNHKPIKNELLNLFITINLCFQPLYEDGYDKFLEKIIYHELGHYLNYFHDSDDSGFKSLCWAGDTATCSSSQFITTYAASEPDEDYAETFAYYALNDRPVNNTLLQQKIDYFRAKFPK